MPTRPLPADDVWTEVGLPLSAEWEAARAQDIAWLHAAAAADADANAADAVPRMSFGGYGMTAWLARQLDMLAAVQFELAGGGRDGDGEPAGYASYASLFGGSDDEALAGDVYRMDNVRYDDAARWGNADAPYLGEARYGDAAPYYDDGGAQAITLSSWWPFARGHRGTDGTVTMHAAVLLGEPGEAYDNDAAVEDEWEGSSLAARGANVAEVWDSMLQQFGEPDVDPLFSSADDEAGWRVAARNGGAAGGGVPLLRGAPLVTAEQRRPAWEAEEMLQDARATAIEEASSSWYGDAYDFDEGIDEHWGRLRTRVVGRSGNSDRLSAAAAMNVAVGAVLAALDDAAAAIFAESAAGFDMGPIEDDGWVVLTAAETNAAAAAAASSRPLLRLRNANGGVPAPLPLPLLLALSALIAAACLAAIAFVRSLSALCNAAAAQRRRRHAPLQQQRRGRLLGSDDGSGDSDSDSETAPSGGYAPPKLALRGGAVANPLTSVVVASDFAASRCGSLDSL
eukprot:366365-Chlamydomonas_euryale.AAC.2